MRPLRLTMQAFGPYPERVVLDFRDALEAGLFGIYGQTGSGKSTIFSAMTFALFGQPAKDDQDPTSLRSDHADAGLQTEVEFVFDIGDRRLVVLRRPEQLRPKQRGDGETRSAHEAFLFDATGIPLDDITDEHRGKIIAEKKVGVVDTAISDTLGYGPNQFRQIVLLPQGRFEKFLSAKTRERLDILRDLFDVSLYRNLAAKLKADAAEAERLVITEREICARRLGSEGFESTDALAAAIVEAEAQCGDLSDAERVLRSQWTLTQAAVEQAKTVDRQFTDAEEKQKVLAELQAGKEEMDSLAARVARTERAAFLRDIESSVSTNAIDVRDATEKRDKAKNVLEHAKTEEKTAAEALSAEIGRTHELETLRQEAAAFARYAEVLEKAESAATCLTEVKSAEQIASGLFSAMQQRIADHRGSREVLTDKLKLARETEARRREMTARLAVVKTSLGAAETFERAERDVIAASKDVEVKSTAHRAALDAENEALLAFEIAENNLAKVQAVHLASKLSPGSPCPVCGSTDHPVPASGAVEHAGLDKAFRETKSAWQQASAESRTSEQNLAAAKGILAEREDRLASLVRPSEAVENLREMTQNLEAGLKVLGSEVDIIDLENSIERAGVEIESFERELENLRDNWNGVSRQVAVQQSQLVGMLSEVPESLQDKERLAAEVARVNQALSQGLEARAAAEKAATAAREVALSAAKDLEAAGSTLDDSVGRHQKSLEKFQERLQQAGLGEEEYQGLKAFFDTIEADRSKIEDYHRKVSMAEDAAKRTADLIDGVVRPDVSKLEMEKEEAEEKVNEAVSRRSSAEHLLHHRIKLRDELADTLRKLDEAEIASGPLRNLAALVNGENPQKLDLETFAIGAMFDQVLMAANLRLGPMTSNRYRLERDLEGAGRGRRGLGIQAFDSHTGKARPTATLSGGETFIAALALALGLADVVESASGKVRLDTIFIDEGFGSLDTENGSGTLDIVLQVLGNLVSRNRAVGLISHVPLVQEAIPNGFYVRKQLDGSSIEARGAL